MYKDGILVVSKYSQVLNQWDYIYNVLSCLLVFHEQLTQLSASLQLRWERAYVFWVPFNGLTSCLMNSTSLICDHKKTCNWVIVKSTRKANICKQLKVIFISALTNTSEKLLCILCTVLLFLIAARKPLNGFLKNFCKAHCLQCFAAPWCAAGHTK